MTTALLHPAYGLTIGGKRVDTTNEPRASTVVGLTVALDLDTPADTATIELGRIGQLEPALDDDATIDLGYHDDSGLTTVLTGTVGLVNPGLVTSTVVVYSGAAALLRSVANETFENKTAGDIVRDLAGRANVSVGNVEDGSQFPAYVADGRRGAFEHVLDLARLCGFDAYVSSDGEVVMERFTGGHSVHVLEHGKHLLELDVRRTPARATAAEAWGESPSTSRGTNAWAWVTKDFDNLHGSAGSGTTVIVLERPVCVARMPHGAPPTPPSRPRSVSRARAAADDRQPADQARRRHQAPQRAGHGANDSFQVRAVTHRLDKRNGFTTEIRFRAARAPSETAIAMTTTIVGTIQEIVRDELRRVYLTALGVVEDVFPHGAPVTTTTTPATSA